MPYIAFVAIGANLMLCGGVITALFHYLALAFDKDRALKADMKKLREAIKEGSCTVSEWKPMSGLALRPQPEGA
jgi:hypothetical protein